MTTKSQILSTLSTLAITAMLAAPGTAAAARARNEIIAPDFTTGGQLPAGARHDWTLGATGVRGWLFCDKMVTADARQIAIT